MMKALKLSLAVCLALAALPSATAQDGDIPRLGNGRPDLNGVWSRPYVPDMSLSNTRGDAKQIGPGELPFTEAGRLNFENYDPVQGDYTGICLPFGLTRSMNSPDPLQFVQTDAHFIYLFEQNTTFKVVNLDGENHSTGIPTWFGHSIASWEGDTLVITTSEFNGKTRLDTIGHPHSDQMTVTEKFTRMDDVTMNYEVTVDDPIYYEEPWSNQRIFIRETDFDLIEYSCMENNKNLWEGRLMPPDYDNWHTYGKEE